MKSIFKYISSALAVAALGVSMTACDDWTEPESVDQNYGDISSAEDYAEYLENLRAYRHKDHKKIYAWFDNSANAFGSQGNRLTALPDSIDVVVLDNPTSITNQMMAEMEKVRKDFGMQVIYQIDFNSIKADWTAKCEELAAQRLKFQTEHEGDNVEIPAELLDPEFDTYMVEAWERQISYFNTYGFDGLMLAFDGKATNHLTDAELKDYLAQANLFLGMAADWHSRNENVPMDFIGKPQNIADNTIINVFRNVFMSESLSAANNDQFTIFMEYAEGVVPDNKIGMAVSMRAIDTDADPKTGFFANGTLAITNLGLWTASHHVGAAGILNVQNDYFVTSGAYANVRQFIQDINPAAK